MSGSYPGDLDQAAFDRYHDDFGYIEPEDRTVILDCGHAVSDEADGVFVGDRVLCPDCWEAMKGPRKPDGDAMERLRKALEQPHKDHAA